MNSSNNKSKGRRPGLVINRIADRVDLAIDVLTLGQYGLEQEHVADTATCEGRRPAKQRTRRRGDCEPTPAISWDWPHSHRDAVSG